MCNKFEQALVNQVDRLFEEDRATVCETVDAFDWKYTILSAPFIRVSYAMFDDELIATLKELTCKALAQQAQFHEIKPFWAPDLPLSFHASRELKFECDPRVRLVGYFGLSQLLAQYDESHPAFDRFCSGLLADERTRKNLREDPELRRLFPPEKFYGLVQGEDGLVLGGLAQGGWWYSIETLRAWCDLRARVGASVTHRLDDPNAQAVEASRLFQKALAPELRAMFSDL
jgi:hypothetical protein